MYTQNDIVLYGSQGVCKIEEIRRINLQGTTNEYYILKPMDKNRSTIYVPVQNENLVKKMRPVLTPEEIYSLIHTIPDEDILWIENENQRKETYKKVLAGCDPHALIQMIKALQLHQKKQQEKGRRLHTADQHFFKAAEKLLHEEFAWVLHLEPEQVLPFIQKELQNTAV